MREGVNLKKGVPRIASLVKQEKALQRKRKKEGRGKEGDLRRGGGRGGKGGGERLLS